MNKTTENIIPASIFVRIKPCPWCNNVPEIILPIFAETWLWHIECRSSNCTVNPKSKHVSIRKTTKKNFEAMLKKIDTLVFSWNSGLRSEQWYKVTIFFYELLKKMPTCL